MDHCGALIGRWQHWYLFPQYLAATPARLLTGGSVAQRLTDRAAACDLTPSLRPAPDVVDVAHARWATGTCITILDTCAAGLGRVLCNYNGAQELSIANFTPRAKPSRADQLRPILPAPALCWIDDVINDDDYKAVKAARNALTHGLVSRDFTLPRQRLDIQVGSIRLNVPTLVELSADTATKHVRLLLKTLPKIEVPSVMLPPCSAPASDTGAKL